MAQRPDLSRYLDAGADFVALTRSQARARAKELVAQGQLAQEQVQGFVDDLVDESRRRTDEMLEVVRREIQRQVKALGIATKDDLARLETRIAGVRAARKPAGRTTKSTAKTAKSAGKTTKKAAKKAKKSAKATRKAAKKPATKATKGAKKSSRSGA
jgi:polyhydroxyalkanoate synthesis regulator phasin